MFIKLLKKCILKIENNSMGHYSSGGTGHCASLKKDED
jgi:hypothetical protein